MGTTIRVAIVISHNSQMDTSWKNKHLAGFMEVKTMKKCEENLFKTIRPNPPSFLFKENK